MADIRDSRNWSFETKQLHIGQEQADPVTDARAVPIYASTSYVFHNAQHAAVTWGWTGLIENLEQVAEKQAGLFLWIGRQHHNVEFVTRHLKSWDQGTVTWENPCSFRHQSKLLNLLLRKFSSLCKMPCNLFAFDQFFLTCLSRCMNTGCIY